MTGLDAGNHKRPHQPRQEKPVHHKKDKNSWGEQEINKTSIKISCLA